VDNRGSSRGRLPVYAALGVPEVWRYRVRRGELRFVRLVDGAYEPLDRSLALPMLTPALVLEALALGAGPPRVRLDPAPPGVGPGAVRPGGRSSVETQVVVGCVAETHPTRLALGRTTGRNPPIPPRRGRLVFREVPARARPWLLPPPPGPSRAGIAWPRRGSHPRRRHTRRHRSAPPPPGMSASSRRCPRHTTGRRRACSSGLTPWRPWALACFKFPTTVAAASASRPPCGQALLNP
jgi:hypothetical protein